MFVAYLIPTCNAYFNQKLSSALFDAFILMVKRLLTYLYFFVSIWLNLVKTRTNFN